MVMAAHPDDESLACSVILQRAVRVGANVRVIYATDGENNPWPQRVLERKWRLNESDRKRWGKVRRGEALAALRVLGGDASNASFFPPPHQKITKLLIFNCRPPPQRLARTIIVCWPTPLLA